MVLFGAAGYTGRKAVRYPMQPPASDIGCAAIAGRDRAKSDRSLKNASGTDDLNTINADSPDGASLFDVIARTRVLLDIAWYSAHRKTYQG
ncbi:MAG: hypothetical protein JXA30_03060 [Deltaproteobacteria bacterium]|nr:hypothetical protein [Deltaproteobacteria bacterium]